MTGLTARDDELHPVAREEDSWTETCWFTFAVPERRLSGQLYPFFRPNQRVAAGGAYFWDESGSTLSTCRFAKNFWHLPLAEGADLADLELANGIRYRCLEPLRRYAVRYLDPDDGEVALDLVFEAIAEPNYLGASHLDQPGRYTGTLRIRDERIAVDAFGMRDRSWGPRSQFGTTLHPGAPYAHGGYSYAAASPRDAERDDLASALGNLGYDRRAIDKALDAVSEEASGASFEQRLRAALKALSRA